MIKECKMKAKVISNKANKDKNWYTDGTNSIIAFECPDGYFIKAQLKKSSIKRGGK